MICFTSDIDWAPEMVIEEMLFLFEKYNIKCTLFCTHYSPIIKNCNKSLFEVALHPNFNKIIFDGEQTSPGSILDDLMKIYPEAIGVRSHSMTQSTPLLDLFKKKKFLYESNQFVPYGNLQPYKLWNGLIRIPYHWEDDIHFLYDRKFDEIGFNIFRKGLTVLDIHPIHIYLNTNSESTYDKAKKFYHMPEKLTKFINKKDHGTKDLIESLLIRLHEKRIKTFTLSEIAKTYSV